MSLSLSLRQTSGRGERQIGDDLSSLVVPAALHLESAFLESNLQHLALSLPLRERVLASEPSAELTNLAPGEPGLRHAGRLLGGAPSDMELAQTLNHPSDTAYIVFGVGLGHTARALRKLTDAPIVIFEPDPGVLRSVLELGPSDLSGFDIVCSTHDLTQIWPSVFQGRRIATIINTPGYKDAFPEAQSELREALSQLVQRSRINHATHRLRAKDWVADVLANVELLSEHPAFLALAGKYRGVPAFIVGAGPSLGKNGAQLLHAQKKGLLFAVNSSARALSRLGVEPQVLACMESIDVSHLLSEVSFIDRVVRAFTLSAHPQTLRTGQGPLLPLWEGLAQLSVPLQELTGYPGLPVSGSVSTLAFALAQRLGCSPIVLVGQDLAYTDGRAYAPGTPYQDSRVRVSRDGGSIELDWCDTLKRTHNQNGHAMHQTEPLARTLAWGGEAEVVTSIGFNAVRHWFEGASVVLGREYPDIRLVNATEGGARIDGFEEASLETLLRDLPELNITAQDLVERARAAQPPLTKEHIAEWTRRQSARVEQARRTARRIQRLAQLCLHSSQTGGHMSDRLARLESAERELSQRVAEAQLLDAWSWGDVDRVMEDHADHHGDAQDAARQSLEFESRFGKTIDQSARSLGRELDLLTQRLNQNQR